jgi:hypothetical protein
MKYINKILLLLFTIVLIGCNQPASIQNELEGLSDQQLELRSKLEQTAKILTELVKDEKVVQELRIATSFSLDQGRDEDVTFSELFYDDAQYKSSFKGKGMETIGSFRARFREFLQTRKKSLEYDIDEDLENYLIQNHLKIYFPYSENWEDEEQINPTISFHPIDNDDENVGYINSEGKSKSDMLNETVWVNDEYGFNNPTFLVVPCEPPIMRKRNINSSTPCEEGQGGNGGNGGNGGEDDDGDDDDGEEDYDKIVLGEVQIRDHFDGLYRGGPDIRIDLTDSFFFTSHDTKPQSQVIRVLERTFSRRDVNLKRWKDIYIDADDDWAEYELAKDLYIWEGDSDARTTISFSSAVEGRDGSQIGLNSTTTVDKDRDHIFRGILTRGVFFAENQTPDPRYGSRNGFRIRAGEDFRWRFENRKGTMSN